MMLRPASLLLALLLAAPGGLAQAPPSPSTPVLAREAAAGSVVLRAKSGGFDFSGLLRSFDGRVYVLESAMGTLTLEASEFECVGAACAGAAKSQPVVSPQGAGPEIVTISGSSTIGTDLMPDLVRGYADKLGAQIERTTGEKVNEVALRLANAAGADIATVDLHRYGSNTAFAALAQGQAQIGMSTRPVTPEEAARIAAASPGRAPPQEHVIGLDSGVVIVHPTREIAALSIDTLARIFAGQITDWSALEQPAGRIQVYAPDSGAGTFAIFARAVLDPAKSTITPYATRLDANGELTEAVLRDPNGIGVTSLSYQRNARAVAIQGSCGLVHTPTAFAIKSDEYPLTRRLQLYTAGPLTQPVAGGLLQFVLSGEGQAIVAAHNFVDLSIEALPFAGQAARFAAPAAGPPESPQMRQLLAEVGTARRLSVTFRFQSGSSVFDPKARQELVRLVELLRGPESKGKVVLFVGFTDTVGSPQANTLLALKRAGQVRAGVLAVAQGQVAASLLGARGYGVLAPVACNDTAANQQLNRRVEVWVRE